MEELNYKKYLLRILMLALSLSALVGIFIFLFGEFGEMEARLMFTTLTMGGYSLTGICSSLIHNKSGLKSFSLIGMSISVLGFLVTVLAIWEIISFEDIWQAIVIFIILAVAIGHISLLLTIKPKLKKIKYAMVVTIVIILIIAIMLIKSTFTEFNENEFYFRILGVFGILDILGTISTPLMNKVIDSKQ